MTPTGSWPMTSPLLTGYSPRTMCRSVPQIVVSVTRITASPTPALGLSTSSTRILFLPRKTLAFILITLRDQPIESVIDLAQTCLQYLAVIFGIVFQELLAQLFAFSVQAVPHKPFYSANGDFD